MAGNALTPIVSREEYRALYLDNLKAESRMNAFNLQANIDWASTGDTEQEAALSATLQAMSSTQIDAEAQQYLKNLVQAKDIPYVLGRLTPDMKKFLILRYANIVGQLARLNIPRPANGIFFLEVFQSLYQPIRAEDTAATTASIATQTAEAALQEGVDQEQRQSQIGAQGTTLQTPNISPDPSSMVGSQFSSLGLNRLFQPGSANTTIASQQGSRVTGPDFDALSEISAGDESRPGFANVVYDTLDATLELARQYGLNALPRLPGYAEGLSPIVSAARSVAGSGADDDQVVRVISEAIDDLATEGVAAVQPSIVNAVADILETRTLYEANAFQGMEVRFLAQGEATPEGTIARGAAFTPDESVRSSQIGSMERERRRLDRLGLTPQAFDIYTVDSLPSGFSQAGRGMRGGRLLRKTKGSARKACRGAGVALREGPKEASHGWQRFGKYMLARSDLDHGDLCHIRYQSGQPIQRMPQKIVGKGVKAVLSSIADGKHPKYEDVEKLGEDEREYVRGILKSASIDPSSVPEPKKDNKEQLKHKFEKMKGEIVAGNDNPKLVKEFKHTLLQMKQTKMLPAGQVNEILLELATLGH